MSCISGCSEWISWDLNRCYWAVPHTLTFFLIASCKVVLAYFCCERHTMHCLDSHWVCSTMNSTCQNSCPHLISLLYGSFPDSLIEIPALNIFHDWAPKPQLLPKGYRGQDCCLLLLLKYTGLCSSASGIISSQLFHQCPVSQFATALLLFVFE